MKLQWMAEINRPAAADGEWTWTLQSRSQDLPRGVGDEYGWNVHKPLPGGDHPTQGRCATRMEALQCAREAKAFYELQIQHEETPAEELVSL